MLEDGTEILDADDDVEFVLDFNIVKLFHLHRDIGVQRLLQNGFVYVSSDILTGGSGGHAFTVIGTLFLNLFCEAGKVYDLAIVVGVYVEQLNARPKIVHELAQGPRREGPAVGGFGLVELGVGWGLGLESQRVCRCDS